MINKVYNYIKKYNMINDGDTVVTGVSGGADSVCLLTILKELSDKIKFEIIVVHVEHGIRGEESLKDAEYVKKLCIEYKVKFRQYSIDVVKSAKADKISTEEAGRRARYDAFEDTSRLFGANKIAVAHNQNDSAETMLLNLFRGSGLSGLHGILPVRDNVIRPILCLTRQEIEDYLNERKIHFCTDYTNFTDEYTRNKIRLNILPQAKEMINQQVYSHMQSTASLVYEAEQFIKSQIGKARADCVVRTDNKVKINIEKLKNKDIYIKKSLIKDEIIYAAQSAKDIESKHIKAVLDIAEKSTGKKINLPYNIIVKNQYGNLIIEKNYKEQQENYEEIILQIPGKTILEQKKAVIEMSIFKREENYIIKKNRYTKEFDYDKIKGTIKIRHRRPKDRIIIESSGRSQKIKDYFINEKIPREKRDKLLLLESDNDILWIIGYRISEKYKITDHTKTILKVQMNGGYACE